MDRWNGGAEPAYPARMRRVGDTEYPNYPTEDWKEMSDCNGEAIQNHVFETADREDLLEAALRQAIP